MFCLLDSLERERAKSMKNSFIDAIFSYYRFFKVNILFENYAEFTNSMFWELLSSTS